MPRAFWYMYAIHFVHNANHRRSFGFSEIKHIHSVCSNRVVVQTFANLQFRLLYFGKCAQTTKHYITHSRI